MKLNSLLETITDAKKLALHLQQLALDHNFEYELVYHPEMHVATVNKIQAIELTLSPSQVKDISDGLRAHAETHYMSYAETHYMPDVDADEYYKGLIEKLAVCIVIGEHTTMHVFDSEDNPIEQYVDEDLELLIKNNIAPYSQFTKLS